MYLNKQTFCIESKLLLLYRYINIKISEKLAKEKKFNDKKPKPITKLN